MTKPAEVINLDPSAEINSELERVRAARAAIARAREQREAIEAPHRKLAEEELALKNEQAIELAEQEHGLAGKKIAIVGTDLGVVIVKRPHAALFKRFQDRGKTSSKELDELVRPCLVYPTVTEYERICDELPATLLHIADAVSGLAGVRAEHIAGKL